jgi:hypothetical protein
MRFEFDKGIPEGCTQWLRENVGMGNIDQDGSRTQQWMLDHPEYAWFYERIRKTSQLTDGDPWRYVPSITIKDPQMATWFALRWAA